MVVHTGMCASASPAQAPQCVTVSQVCGFHVYAHDMTRQVRTLVADNRHMQFLCCQFNVVYQMYECCQSTLS